MGDKAEQGGNIEVTQRKRAANQEAGDKAGQGGGYQGGAEEVRRDLGGSTNRNPAPQG